MTGCGGGGGNKSAPPTDQSDGTTGIGAPNPADPSDSSGDGQPVINYQASDSDRVNSAFTPSIEVSGFETVLWEKLSGPGDVSFSNSSIVSPSISASADGNYDVAITAWNKAGQSKTQTISFQWDTQVALEFLGENLDQGFWNNRATNSAITLEYTTQEEVAFTWSQERGDETVELNQQDQTIIISGPVDGEYAVALTFTDELGNETKRTLEFVRDTIIPNLNSLPDLKVNQPSMVEATCISDCDGAKIDWTSASPFVTIEKDEGNPFLAQISASENGKFDIEVTISDDAGNLSSKTFVYEYSKTDLLFTISANNIITNKSMRLETSLQDSWQLDWKKLTGEGQITLQRQESDLIVSTDKDDTYTVDLLVRDEFGNLAKKTLEFTWDTVAPTIDDLADQRTNKPFTIKPVISGAVRYQWQASSSHVTFDSQDQRETRATVQRDGTYELSITATDLAGNSATETFQLVYDTIAPKISVTSPEIRYEDGKIYTRKPFQVSFAADDPSSPLVWKSPDNVTLKMQSSSQAMIEASAEGDYEVVVSSTDGLNSSQEIIRFVWDQTKPRVENLADRIDTNAELLLPEITVNEPLSLVNWKSIDDNENLKISYPNTKNRLQPMLSATTDGSYRVEIQLTDRAGNLGEQTLEFVWDTVAPGLADFKDLITNKPVLVEGELGEDNEDYSYNWVSVPTLKFSAPQSRQTMISAPSDQDYIVALTVTDRASNKTTKFFTLTWDTKPPTLNVVDGNTGLKVSPGDRLSSKKEISLNIQKNYSSLEFESIPADQPGLNLEFDEASSILTVSADEDGEFPIKLTITNERDNTNELLFFYVSDTKAPEIPAISYKFSSEILDYMDQDIYTNASNITFMVSNDEDLSYEWSAEFNGTERGSPISGEESSWALQNGVTEVYLKVSDKAGNVSQKTMTVRRKSVWLHRLLTWEYKSGDKWRTAISSTQTSNVHINEDARFRILAFEDDLSDIDVKFIYNGVGVASLITDPSSPHPVVLVPMNGSSANNSLVLIAQDRYGNRLTRRILIHFDGEKPIVPSPGTLSLKLVEKGDLFEFQVSGKRVEESNVRYTLYVSDKPPSSMTSLDQILENGRQVAGVGGSWRDFNLSHQVSDPYQPRTYNVVVTDKAGNRGVYQPVQSTFLNINYPVGSYTERAQIELAGRCFQPEERVSIFIGGELQDSTSCDEYNWSKLLEIPSAAGREIEVKITHQGIEYKRTFVRSNQFRFVRKSLGEFEVETLLKYDNFGDSMVLSQDEKTLFISASGHGNPIDRKDTYLGGSGSIFIYRKSFDGSWSFDQLLKAPKPTENAGFGASLATDGDILAVSASNEDRVDASGKEMLSAGSVYIYRLTQGSWRLEQSLFEPPQEEGSLFNRFGKKLAIRGDTLVVASDRGFTGDNASGEGQLYVYQRDGGPFTLSQVISPLEFLRHPSPSYVLRAAEDRSISVTYGGPLDESEFADISSFVSGEIKIGDGFMAFTGSFGMTVLEYSSSNNSWRPYGVIRQDSESIDSYVARDIGLRHDELVVAYPRFDQERGLALKLGLASEGPKIIYQAVGSTIYDRLGSCLDWRDNRLAFCTSRKKISLFEETDQGLTLKRVETVSDTRSTLVSVAVGEESMIAGGLQLSSIEEYVAGEAFAFSTNNPDEAVQRLPGFSNLTPPALAEMGKRLKISPDGLTMVALSKNRPVIYTRGSLTSSWQQQQVIDGFESNSLCREFTLNFESTFLIIGTPSRCDIGSVRLYRKSMGEWVHHQTLKVSEFLPEATEESAKGRNFGSAIQLSPDHRYLFVGAKSDPYDVDEFAELSGSGAVFVFETNLFGEFIYKQKITAPESLRKEAMNFGAAIVANSESLFVGSPRYEEKVPEFLFEQDIGMVSRFTKTENGWVFVDSVKGFVQNQDLSGRDPDIVTELGTALALKNNLLYVGAPSSRWENKRKGGVLVYEIQDTTLELKNIYRPDFNAKDQNIGASYGSSLAILDEFMFVGAIRDGYSVKEGREVPRNGAVYSYRMEGDQLNYFQKITLPAGYTNGKSDSFGFSLDAAKDTLIIGAPWQHSLLNGDFGSYRTGAVYTLRLKP